MKRPYKVSVRGEGVPPEGQGKEIESNQKSHRVGVEVEDDLQKETHRSYWGV